ncbi:MAG: phosphoribosyl-ATP diphosphatase, partial [Waddliaceae bacterium]
VERKLSEEAFEVVEAAWKGKKKDLVYEAADLLYHLVVLLEKNQVSLKEVEQELTRRQK